MFASSSRSGRSPHAADEPVAEGDDGLAWGGERIYAVGFTPAGFPYGVTEAEFREANMRYASRAGWARAKFALYEALAAEAGPHAAVDVGWVRRLGGGLDRHAFHAQVDIEPDPAGLSGLYVALVPHDTNEAQRRGAEREAALLRRLGRAELPFDVPRVVGLVQEQGGGAVTVETPLDGIPLDLRAGRQRAVRPWEVVGEVAAAIHALDPAPFAEVLSGCVSRCASRRVSRRVSRRADALCAVQSAAEGLDHPLVHEARDWALEHLPPDEPCALLHGDLLGQNILCPLLDPEGRIGVIDWTRARIGDPAEDLAIVTCGVRRPFQLAGGLTRLLEAYRAAGGRSVMAAQVHLHELCLVLGWYRDSLDPARRSQPPEQELNRLRGLLGCARASAR